MKKLKSSLGLIAFPGVMLTGLVLCSAMISEGLAPGLVPSLVMVVFAIPLIALFEYLIPFRQKWNRNDGDVWTDVLHMFFVQILWPRALTVGWMLILPIAVIWVSQHVSIFDGKPWPHHWPMALQLCMALLIAEFGRYWVHRLAHEVSWLWRFHAIHHSPNRLYWLNAARFHPIEKIYLHIPETLPFILLGASPDVIALYYVVTAIHGLFQHSNIDVKLGPLNYIFAMAELHRFHHSKIIDESNTNYGNNLIVWDLVFGTFYWPKDRLVGPIGLLNSAYPKNFIGQMLAPFSKTRLDKPADYADRAEQYHQQAEEEAHRYRLESK